MKETIKRLYKPFILIFLVSFLVINWHDISFLFNYRIISNQFSNLLEKSEPQGVEATEVEVRGNDYFEKGDTIEIPKIGIEAPIVLAKNGEEDLENLLDKGVLLHPESVLPGEQGTTIILGHSAPPGWPEINYDDIFNYLIELEAGDEIIIYYNHSRYIYEVYDKKIFYSQDEENILPKNNGDSSLLVLSTCWPPGKDFKRLVVLSKMAQK